MVSDFNRFLRNCKTSMLNRNWQSSVFTRLKSKIVVALLSENLWLLKATFVVEACDNLAGTALLLYPNYSVKAILKAFCVRIKQIKRLGDYYGVCWSTCFRNPCGNDFQCLLSDFTFTCFTFIWYEKASDLDIFCCSSYNQLLFFSFIPFSDYKYYLHIKYLCPM